SRIANRSREYEIDESLKEYYHFLWKDYDEWALDYCDASEILIIDTNNLDLANNEEDVTYVLNLIEEKLKEVRGK
ncbi:MAG: deoxynucleoside kinase, partial [Peptostreptococcaceae bacterium]|nr:deoxynucleoside kinase [Peptostreptococcaceae bacterium]